MAKKLSDIHDAIIWDGGGAMAMRLIMKTGMTTDMMKTAPDTPENVKKFQDAYKDIIGKPCPIN